MEGRWSQRCGVARGTACSTPAAMPGGRTVVAVPLLPADVAVAAAADATVPLLGGGAEEAGALHQGDGFGGGAWRWDGVEIADRNRLNASLHAMAGPSSSSWATHEPQPRQASRLTRQPHEPDQQMQALEQARTSGSDAAAQPPGQASRFCKGVQWQTVQAVFCLHTARQASVRQIENIACSHQGTDTQYKCRHLPALRGTC